MAKPTRVIERIESDPPQEVTETITYLPNAMDPPVVKWGGQTFQANVPKELTGHEEGHPDATDRTRMNMHLIERARENKFFAVGNQRPKRERNALPTNAQEYRTYIVEWLKDPAIDSADKLIARFAADRTLQATCEVGPDDFERIASVFMPRLADLAKADGLTEGQLAQMWISHGIMQLPW